ncbi:MAG TPA: ATP-binding protein [Opitutaceae bacterium]|nr:ATP-binding protein [Opitutaceae bacterium]
MRSSASSSSAPTAADVSARGEGVPRPALVGVAYFVLHLAAHLSARFFEISPGVSLWYPPAGLALAALILLGPRFAPVVLSANIVGAWISKDFGVSWPIFLFPALITANYASAAALARRWCDPRRLPRSTRDHALLIAGVVLAPAGIALAGTAAAGWLVPLSAERFLQIAAQWWLGDASGLLTVVPPVLVFVGPWMRGERPSLAPGAFASRRPLLVLAQALALAASLWMVFGTEALPRTLTFYLCLLPLVWICLQHGLPGATLATLALTMGGLLGLRLTDGSMESATGFLFLELTAAVVGLGLGSTVTRRSAAERHLAASKERFDRVIAGAHVGVWDWDHRSGHVTFNDRCAEMLGRAPGSLPPSVAAWEAHVHPADRPRIHAALQQHFQRRAPLFEIEYRLQPATGGERWIHTRGSVVARDEHGVPLVVSGTHVDVTDRRQAQAEAERLLQVTEATTDFVLTTEPDGRILYANAAFQRFWSASATDDVRGRRLPELQPESGRAALAHVIAALPSCGVWNGELQLANAAGAETPVSVVALLHRSAEDGAPDSLSFVLRDISRRKQAEAARLEQERRLQQLQKTESLGVLAGGIAHDFNNLLTAMLGNAGLARCDLPVDSPVHESLTQIETAAQRAADLCQQMLAYAGRRPLSASDVDLNSLIAQTQRLFQVSISKKIAVQLALAPEPVVVHAAGPQLQQVILNLVLNAAESIGDREGVIAVRTTGRNFGEDELRHAFGAEALPAGRYALCEVQDSGAGIPPELRRRIFEPFFTTKTTGHGLGLAAVHGVVTSHRGAITVDSTPGEGSTFRFILPLATATVPTAVAEPAAAAWTGSGLVLVVDDEPGVQRVTEKMLRHLGFTTLGAADGAEAVALFRAHSRTLRLVLLDLLMPQMDGVETFAALQRIDPAVPVILMSGFTGNLNLERFTAAKPAALLAKPFTRAALQASLESVLRAKE